MMSFSNVRRSPDAPPYCWTATDVQRLEELVAERVPTKSIARQLRRSPKAVRNKASQMGLSLVGESTRRRRGEPDGERERTVATVKRVKLWIDFDFRALSYEERLALADALVQSVPASHRVQSEADAGHPTRATAGMWRLDATDLMARHEAAEHAEAAEEVDGAVSGERASQTPPPAAIAHAPHSTTP
jgi:hypothetical protein